MYGDAIFEQDDSKESPFRVNVCPAPDATVRLNRFTKWMVDCGIDPLVADPSSVGSSPAIAKVMSGSEHVSQQRSRDRKRVSAGSELSVGRCPVSTSASP